MRVLHVAVMDAVVLVSVAPGFALALIVRCVELVRAAVAGALVAPPARILGMSVAVHGSFRGLEL